MTDPTSRGREALERVLAAAERGCDDGLYHLIEQSRSFLASLTAKAAEADALPCTYCSGISLTECRSLWPEQRKCCPDCDHSAQTVARRWRELDAEADALRDRPEERSNEPPTDCKHEHARCEGCRWPVWTLYQTESARQEGARMFHLFHGDTKPPDCVYCERDALRAEVASLEALRKAAAEVTSELDRLDRLDAEGWVLRRGPSVFRSALYKLTDASHASERALLALVEGK